MRSVPSAFLNASGRYNARLVWSGGEISGEDIKSFTLTNSLNGSSDRLNLGATPAAQLSATVITEAKLTDKVVQLYISRGGYELQLGSFTITKAQASDGDIELTGYDAMYVAMERAYYPTITGGTTAKKVLQDIATAAGLTLSAPSSVDAAVSGVSVGYTLREMTGYMSALLGCSARISGSGALTVQWFTSSGLTLDGDTIYTGGAELGSDAWTLGKITCSVTTNTTTTDSDGITTQTQTTVDYVSGDGSTGISLSNPFMTQTNLDSIYDSIGGMSYKAGEVSALGDIRIEPGDIVTITDTDGSTSTMPVMSETLQYDGGLRMTLNAYAENESDGAGGGGVSGPLTEAIDRYAVELATIKKLDADNAEITKAKITTLTAKQAEIETLVATKATIEDLDAAKASIADLTTRTATIEGAYITTAKVDELLADKADVSALTAAEANITDLTTRTATIEQAYVKQADVETLVADSAAVKKLEADKATVTDLTAATGRIADLETTRATVEQLNAANANIEKLQTDKLDATAAAIKYAEIDFANIDMAAVQKLFTKSGMIEDLDISTGHVTGELVGVTIKGDLIEGGTVKADKLVVKGSDGLYYKLNTDGCSIEAEQTSENSLNGSVITAKSITATKVSVDDLVAFGATIGGFHITDSAIYSGVKATVDSPSQGIYEDSTGQLALGDDTNYLRYYKASDGKWKLEIRADSFVLQTGKSIADELAAATSTATAAQSTANTASSTANTALNAANSSVATVTTQYYDSTSATEMTGGSWSDTSPTWREGHYIWSRTKTVSADGKTTEYSEAVCITGNTGKQGEQGVQGIQGAQGVKGDKGDSGESGRNLIYNSGEISLQASSRTGYKATTKFLNYYDNDLQILRGKTLTFSLEMELVDALGDGTNFMRAGWEIKLTYSDGTIEYRGLWKFFNTTTATSIEKGRYSSTFTVQDKEISSIQENCLYIQHLASGSVSMSKPKLEFGDVATDWTPAPEDVVTAQSTADQANTDVQALSTTVVKNYVTSAQLDDRITSEVGALTTTIEGNKETIEKRVSDVEQTSGEWSATVSKHTEYIEKLDDDVQAVSTTVSKTMKLTEEGLTLSAGGSTNTVLITNDSINFKVGEYTAAYISDKQLWIKDTVIENSMTLGKFAFIPRDSGNLSLVRKDG